MSERVCAVVVTHNRRALLPRCLDSLLDQARPPDKVLVVDNASTDGTSDLLSREFPQVAALRLPRNEGGAGGFAAGMTWALAQGADWTWLLDDDVTADRDCLKELLEVSMIEGKRVVVPRRLTTEGNDCASEAILVEGAQRFEVVRVDPRCGRYHPVDLFTFEGPLIHRSVAEEVGVPNRKLFICGDDILYAIRINRRMGPLSCALATRAVVRKQLHRPQGIKARSRLKAWMTGDPAYEVFEDEQHWKLVYELRNRHIIWHELGWRRRRLQLLVLHLGYIGADLIHAVHHGWNWPLRLKWNVAAWLLGVFARDGKFLDPEAYRAQAAARRRPARRRNP
jgi:rhamnopyranosyl-N-acetylglucosaminyl-diphospho-decaprenol beta-1,3/1,4-galactofuranosyltransferase